MKVTKVSPKLTLLTCSALASLAMACGGSHEEPESPAEQAADDAADATEEAVEDTGDAIEEAGDDAEDAVD